MAAGNNRRKPRVFPFGPFPALRGNRYVRNNRAHLDLLDDKVFCHLPMNAR
jgi:hypothetical protein